MYKPKLNIMKKNSLLLIILLSFSLAVSAQRRGYSVIKWLSLELKGGYGSTVLINSDVLAEKNASMNFFTGAYNYGARFGITFGDYVGIFVERLSENFKQSYDLIPGEPLAPYTKTQSFKSQDWIFELRYTNDYGFYVEMGPVFSTFKTAEENNSSDYAFTPRYSYLQNFSEKNTGLMFGLGFSLVRGERISVNLGLRGTYMLGDFVSNDNFYVLNDGVFNGTYTGAASNPFSIKMMFGINYFFGFWGDASCGRGRLMFFQ